MTKLNVNVGAEIGNLLPYMARIDEILGNSDLSKIQGLIVLCSVIAMQVDPEDVEVACELLRGISERRDSLFSSKH